MRRLSVPAIKRCLAKRYITWIVLIAAVAMAGHAMAHAVTAPSGLDWPMSAHAAPSWSAFSDPVLHFIAFLAQHRFIFMPVLICGAILLGIAAGFRKAKGWLIIPLGIGLAVFNLIFGTEISGMLIYHFGAEGRATITGAHATATIYNNHDVRSYDVLIKKADGGIAEVGFADDDFNVYPAHNATVYPGSGDHFNVRYLEHFPQDFVILGEDDSPWAHEMRCEKLGDARAEAEEKLKFAPDIASYRAAVDTAVKAEAGAGCTE